MASKFASRSQETELMDDLNSSGSIIDQTLRELETINKWLGGNHVTLDGLDQLLNNYGEVKETLTIADLGCGGGDILKLIAKWARKRNIDVNLIGIDANPHVISFAENNTKDFPEISYRSINIFSEEFRSLNLHIATSTLFTHHFTDVELVDLLKCMKSQCKIGIVINDLHRHWIAYHSIKWLTTVFSKSEMVKNDAAVSVLRSFHKSEIQSIMNSAGIDSYSLRWMWAFRWQIVGRFT